MYTMFLFWTNVTNYLQSTGSAISLDVAINAQLDVMHRTDLLQLRNGLQWLVEDINRRLQLEPPTGDRT
jgi:hypothetical protein